MDNRPIGIFDSGYGGLTILKEVHELMPQESLVYFGDSKNAPYGQYSEEICTEKALQCVDFLRNKGCKAFIVGCNLMSGVALPTLKRTVSEPIIGVIEAGAETAKEKLKQEYNNIGIIATPVLIKKGIYQETIKKLIPNITVQGVGTPELVPLVESQKLEGPEVEAVLKNYKSEFAGELDMLVLGCTHYPLLKNAITKVFGEKVVLINPAKATAKKMYSILKSLDLQCDDKAVGEQIYYTSADAEGFKRFMEEVLGMEGNCVYKAILD